MALFIFAATDSRSCLAALRCAALHRRSDSPASGGYDGSTCISDFRSVILPPAAGGAAGNSFGSGVQSQRNLFADGLGLLSSANAADAVLQAYSAGDSLSRQQLQTLLSHLSGAVRALPARRLSGSGGSSAGGGGGGSGGGGSSSGAGGSHPFDTSQADRLVDLGFPRERVLAVMTRMHAAGQNTKNIDLVADWCIRDSADDAAPAPQSNPALDRQQSSERAELRKKVEQLLESQEEARTCKVCFDELIDVALIDCGHLAVCNTCAESLASRRGPCPICQTDIKGKLKVYWT